MTDALLEDRGAPRDRETRRLDEHGRPAPVREEIHPLIRHRWSPRAVGDRPVSPEDLRALFEAARWAPSSYNEQPWRFLVATDADPDWLRRLRGYLSEGNAWATRAPVLVASAYRTTFTRNGKPNRMALRDLGAAEENLVLQAYDLGLVAHQMAGFDHRRLRDELLPDGFEPGSMTAVGHPGDPDALDDDVRDREESPRTRKDPGELVFAGSWGKPAPFLG